MKRILSLLMLSTIVLWASATIRYVSPMGDDNNDGTSWETAKATITSAVSASSSGDEVYVAAGTYKETVSLKDGVQIRGGYNAATGLRDIENFKSILDGEGLGKFLIVKYSPDCTVPTYVEGMIIQNSDYGGEGGGAFIRGNVILDKCIIRNCKGSGGGGVYAQASDPAVPAVIRNTTIELCEATSSGGGAYLYQNAVMEGCIVRGNCGKYGAIRLHKAGCAVSNCVIYNNSCTVDGWPGSAGIFNEAGGKVYNCTVANNQGIQYAGVHSVDEVYNSVFWGNKDQEGDTDPANFISGESNGSSHNYADEGFDGSSFASINMSRTNMDANGPNFNNPTTFVGAPTNDGEIAAMRSADFSLLSTSPLINKGLAAKAPATDILGVARPIGSGVDVGAYEYDPNAVQVPVTGVDIYETKIEVIQGKTAGATAIITPGNATNKRLTWTSDNPAIASVDANGGITGVEIGETVVRVKTVDGNFTDYVAVEVLPIPPVYYPVEVLEADELYKAEDYTVPSYIPFLIAKEAARIDSATCPDVTVIAGKIAEMNAAAAKLVGKEEPYNMVANINGDPATRMAFCWFTNEGVTEGKVQLMPFANATADDFEHGKDDVINISATPTTTKPLRYAVSTSGILKAANLDTKTAFTYVSHKAIAENLQPGITYSWRVGYAGHWSPIAQFSTKEAKQGEYSFIYMTDSHIMDAEYVDNARWCATAAAKAVPEARFCLFPGDFVETGTESNSEWEWERWFEESIRPVIMQMPIVPTDGNHDDSPLLNYDYHFNTDWEFATKAKTKPQFSGITYSFVYGDVLFLVYSLQDWWRASGSSESSMKSTYLSSDVKNWFKEQIAKHPDTKYRVTLSHKNIFSGSGHSVDAETPMFREIMLPILKECEIDLAIQGHDHCYEVIGPVNPDTRTAITEAITDVETVAVDANKNATGKKGGTFKTDDGTLYFIGATCGRKRYYPYDRDKMDSYYDKHKVTNYFDLMTGMFGQPGAPSFTKFTVKNGAIELNSYTADQNGNATLLNTMKVVRTKEHTVPAGFEDMRVNTVTDGSKFIRDGQVLIFRDGKTYNVLGEIVE
ncbi:MAG: metallophosphoesterase [Paludibacteraceae bacterium]|nr:metallophosphoesterase [Paludibacteraceae bacterium]